MGVLKFRLPPGTSSQHATELKRAYVTGIERIPERVGVDIRDDTMVLYRDRIESGRVHVPWPVPGGGIPIVSTGTLVERDEPYDLAVELARGKLNDVLNQAADWRHLGLWIEADLEAELREARRSFSRAATARDDAATATEASQQCLALTHQAARDLAIAYTEQVLHRRLEHVPKLPSLLACGIPPGVQDAGWAPTLVEGVNAIRVACPWRMIAPEEGQFRWDQLDAQLQWCQRRKLPVLAGPLVEFRPAALPDWLWLWEGDFEAIVGMVTELVRHVITRYRGRIASWHLVGRPCSTEVLGLSEEDQFRLTARVLQIAQFADSDAHLVVDLDRPWAEWMANSLFHLGPLHVADNLVRAEVGLSGLGLEIAPGYSSPGSPIHDLLDFSRMLDLFSLLNLPLHLTMAVPSSIEPDLAADPVVRVEAAQWPRTPDESLQTEWARQWISLAMAKPFVKSVTWHHACDSVMHLYPRGGLFRADDSPKPAFEWLKTFRGRYLI
jgi:hypothetical protein